MKLEPGDIIQSAETHYRFNYYSDIAGTQIFAIEEEIKKITKLGNRILWLKTLKDLYIKDVEGVVISSSRRSHMKAELRNYINDQIKDISEEINSKSRRIFVIWTESDIKLTSLAKEIAERSYIRSKKDFKDFMRNLRDNLEIAPNKMEHFAYLISQLHENGCYKLSVGKGFLKYFQEHINDYSNSTTKIPFKAIVSKLNANKSSVLREINTILIQAKIIDPKNKF